MRHNLWFWFAVAFGQLNCQRVNAMKAFVGSAPSTRWPACTQEAIIFAADYDAVLTLPPQIYAHEIVLPQNGALLLKPDAAIHFTNESDYHECHDQRRLHIQRVEPRKWFDAGTWSSSVLAENQAMPMLERAPCQNESVYVKSKAGAALSIDLQGAHELALGELVLEGSKYDARKLNAFLRTDLGEILFKNSYAAAFETAPESVNACGCHKHAANLEALICPKYADSCRPPHCRTPIKPRNACCAMCGALLQVPVAQCTDKLVNQLRNILQHAIERERLSAVLDYHVAYVDGDYLQTIIVDRDVYDAQSVEFARNLNATIDWQDTLSIEGAVRMLLSGRPYDPDSIMGAVIGVIAGIVLISGLILLAVRAGRSANTHFRDMVRWPVFFQRSSFGFVRFQNAASGNSSVEVVNAPRHAMRYNAATGEVRQQHAFNNPIFGEQPAAELPDDANIEMGIEAERLSMKSLARVAANDDGQSGADTDDDSDSPTFKKF